MSQTAVKTLMDRWRNDQVFRTQFRSDPESAVRSTGVELDDAEWAALRSVDWSVSDAELESRINKTSPLTYPDMSHLNFTYGRC